MLRRLWYWMKRHTPQTFKPVILVTGCSSGIGLALAKFLYRMPQYRVVITARRASLETVRGRFQESERFWLRELDVTSQRDRDRLIQEIEEKWGGVNILVNNAGVSYRSVVEHMTADDEFRQMNANYFGPVELIRLVLPTMRRLGRGKIINISSVSGMLAMPTMASYSASKYALEGLSEALWYETKPFGIDVSLIQPGFIRSNSFKNVYYTKLSHPDHWQEGIYGDYYANMSPFIEKLMGLSRTDPFDVARLVIKVIQQENPPLWIPATIDARIFYYLRRWIPRRFLMPLLFAALPKARTWGSQHTKKRTGTFRGAG